MKKTFLKITNRLLAGLDLELVQRSKEPPLLYPPNPAEREEIDRLIREFAARQDPSRKNIANADQWAAYLDDVRLSFFAEVLQLILERGIPLEHQRVADFGSGTGYLLRMIHRQAPHAELVGFDSFAEVNELASMICPAATYDEDFDEGEELFDLLVCTEVLEHLKYPKQRLQQLAGRVRAGGHLVLTVPNGRTDTHPANNAREDGTGYWGHCHYWSPESWPLFLAEAIGGRGQIEAGLLPSGGNFAVITLNEQPTGPSRHVDE